MTKVFKNSVFKALMIRAHVFVWRKGVERKQEID